MATKQGGTDAPCASFFKKMPPREPYKGKVKAVILDWAGTIADAHVLAPAEAFMRVFEKHGVPITMSEARGPMGSRKDIHIAKVLEDESVRARWEKAKGYIPNADPSGDDVQKLYHDFVPIQLECLEKYTQLIPGVAEKVDCLKQTHGIKIGTTTGFTKVMVDILLRDAKKQGFVPDSSVAGDEVPGNMGSRPAPFMIYQNMRNLGVWPIESVVKVDDTASGIIAGFNAGCWTVGVAAYSNYTDVNSLEQWKDMSEGDRENRREKSRKKLMASNAHYVIDSVAQLPSVIDDINRRLLDGEKP